MNDDITLFCESNRLAGTPGEIAALEYAEETMKSLGLETSRQKVSHSGERIFESFNVTGIKRSSVKNAPIIILCAHADNAANGAGATDDAAGLAVLLEAARQTAILPDDAAEVRYIAFTSEEYALLGSEVYVSSLSKGEKNRVEGVLNLDMFASKNASNVYAYFENNEIGYDFWIRLTEAAHKVEIEITLERSNEIGSDSISFEKAGMPAVLLTHNVVKGEYHRRADTQDKVDEEKLKYALDLSVAWIGSELTD
jgi:Zn-dependent M28 family amino/carboxypeptidase